MPNKCCPRSGISQVVGVLCRFFSALTEEHWRGAKRVMRYLAGTKQLGIVYVTGGAGTMAYGDSDHAADVDKRKSCSGTVSIKSGVATCCRALDEQDAFNCCAVHL
jgi:hypothetical protein